MTTQEKRIATLKALIEDYGCAQYCEVLALDEAGRWAEVGQWAAMQDDDRGCNGGPWWTTGDDLGALLDGLANEEHPSDWPVNRVFDLDTFNGTRNGWSSGVRGAYIATELTPQVLLIGHYSQSEPLLDAGAHGPFATVESAHEYARAWRERKGLPHGNAVPTAEENEAWTEAGWTFGIFPLRVEEVTQ
jgi:hypothetical protein